jgi:predicted Fe-Mo cluster-binding NifX family protein
MKIAVASNGLDIALHFSQCLNFNYYTTKSYEIIDSQNIPAQGLSGEEYAQLMDRLGIDVIMCDCIEPATKEAFEEHGIGVVNGAQGNALKAAEAYVESKAEAEDDYPDDSED